MKVILYEGGTCLHVSGQALSGAIARRHTQPALVEVEPSHNRRKKPSPRFFTSSDISGDVENATELQNDVRQGPSSSIFTLNMREAEAFLAANGLTAASLT
jgi:aldehyde dehydrogenase (NAD+)